MWQKLAQESFAAASRLKTGGLSRSCVSRAYYAVFAAVTHALIQKGLTPRADFGTWSHAELPEMAQNHLLDHGAAAINLAYAVRRLYRLRLWADYVPDLELTEGEAFEAMGLTNQVFRQLRGQRR